MRKTPTPPRWADRLLEWFCADHRLEEIQGDLYERFQKRVKVWGEKEARRQYAWEVLGFLRPRAGMPFGLKRDPKMYSKPNYTDMIRNYLLTTLRLMRRQAGTAFIYVAGLSLGIAGSLLIFLVVQRENSFDRYHSKADRIYRVELTELGSKSSPGYTYPGLPTGLATALRNDFPEVEKVVSIKVDGQLIHIPGKSGDDGKFKEVVAFVGNEQFNVFDYQWLAGTSKEALSQPNTAVLTQSCARKFFGNATGAIGKSIRLSNGKDLLITGLIADYPVNTDFPFPILASYATLKSLNPDFNTNEWQNWSNNHQTYVLLKKDAPPRRLESRFPAMIKKYVDEKAAQQRAYSLLPLRELHFHSNYSWRSADPKLLMTLSLIGAFLLVIACINFVNLATAQAARRAKEVGVRKALGGNRWNLIFQFMTEVGMITFVAVVLSVGVASVTLPYVTQLTAVPLLSPLLFSLPTALFLMGIWLLTNMLAGLYPAFVLSGFSPVTALKNAVSGRQMRGVTLRNGLIVLQFSISLILIASTLIITRQLAFFQHSDLGFNKEAVLTVGIPNNDPVQLQTLRNQWLQSPQLENVSFSMNSASDESNWMHKIEYKPARGIVDIKTQMKWVDTHFLTTYDIQLLAGEPFRTGDTLPKVMVNEVFVKRLGLNSLQEALGQVVYSGDRPLTIIGVVRNFHVNSLHQNIDPTMLAMAPQYFSQANIRLKPAALTAGSLNITIDRIKKTWVNTYPDQVFDYRFLDQTLAQAYLKETQTAQLAIVATSVAILISCLGLFGLVVFTAEQRRKEIGIRKVLGASVTSLAMLLSKEFLKLVGIAFAIAIPIAWYAMNGWLENFAFRAEVSWWVFALAGGIILLIALLTISYQTIKAALANPVKSLRTE